MQAGPDCPASVLEHLVESLNPEKWRLLQKQVNAWFWNDMFNNHMWLSVHIILVILISYSKILIFPSENLPAVCQTKITSAATWSLKPQLLQQKLDNISLQKPCSALQGLVLTLKSFREPQNQLSDSVNPSLMSFISHLMSVRVVHQL